MQDLNLRKCKRFIGVSIRRLASDHTALRLQYAVAEQDMMAQVTVDRVSTSPSLLLGTAYAKAYANIGEIRLEMSQCVFGTLYSY